MYSLCNNKRPLSLDYLVMFVYDLTMLVLYKEPHTSVLWAPHGRV